MKKSDVGIAIIGTGYWGKNLIRNYRDIGFLKLLCDSNKETLKQYNEQYPELKTCLALSDVLNRDDIQAVVIATPAETHYTMARESLLADKHVYVEKPLVLSENEGIELIQLAKERKRVLMVGHLLQYHPAFLRLKEMVQSGELGRINYIYSHRLNLGKIRREENILWSFAPHDISMILTLAGEEPEAVMATGGNYLHNRIADVTTTNLEFPSGLRAHIFVSWLHPFKEQKLVVVGDRKMAVFDDTLPWPEKLLVYEHSIEWKDNIPIPSKADATKFQIEAREPLKEECKHFLDCIINGKEPLTSGKEGIRVVRVLNACQSSLDNNAERILLNDTPDGSPLWVSSASDDQYVHPSAIVDDGVTVGKGTKIWCFSHVLSGSVIGDQCNIGQNVMIGPDVTVGNRCKIQNNVSVYQGVTLEDGVFCGPSMVFTNVYNPRAEISKMNQARNTVVRRGATIGANATIICGIILGQYCFIGAGAVVNQDVPDFALIIGNPGKQGGWVCECGETLPKGLTCHSCGKRYKKDRDAIERIKE